MLPFGVNSDDEEEVWNENCSSNQIRRCKHIFAPINQRRVAQMNKILIIQDSPSVNAMIKYRLQSGGFSVEAVETGEVGVE